MLTDTELDELARAVAALGDDPSIEVLAALYLTFQAGERAGRDDGRVEGRAALAGEMRKLMGVPA